MGCQGLPEFKMGASLSFLNGPDFVDKTCCMEEVQKIAPWALGFTESLVQLSQKSREETGLRVDIQTYLHTLSPLSEGATMICLIS